LGKIDPAGQDTGRHGAWGESVRDVAEATAEGNPEYGEIVHRRIAMAADSA
jgi:hypothetical protein